MLSLEQEQQSLLAMIKGRTVSPGPGPDPDPWLERVASSRGLQMVREIALWWRRFQIESQCRYTSRMMKRLDCFDSYVAQYFRSHSTSPSIEQFTSEFLSSLEDHCDPVLRAVAQFELACITLRNTTLHASTITWDREPSRVLTALDRFSDLPSPEPQAQYVMKIGPGSLSHIICDLQPLTNPPHEIAS
ncbi:MAG: hypothetical protein M3Y50_11580 [Acidobacteriota bacterium]|nr:hypothetical protein [Acidobacteriota bacterium]